MTAADWLAARAAALDRRGLTRQLTARSLRTPLVDLAGNDYLGLSSDTRVVEAAVAATRAWGAGSTGSRLVTGTTEVHAELEAALADFCVQEAALVFSSGYLANLGAVTALGGPGTLVVHDAHVHASMVDAARLSRSPVEVTPHNDVEAVARCLRGRSQPRAIVVTESVFSVLGDAAPLEALADVCARYDATLLVDEAHGLGVTGDGRGSVFAAGLAGLDHVLVTVTLSKALGSQGGVVLGPGLLRAHLINSARPFLFDTALAPGAAAAARAAVGVIDREPERVVRLRTVSARLAGGCGVAARPGAVISVPMPEPAAAVAAAAECRARGLRVGCFRPPSAPDGISRIRLTARATLDDDTLDDVCDVLAQVVQR